MKSLQALVALFLIATSFTQSQTQTSFIIGVDGLKLFDDYRAKDRINLSDLGITHAMALASRLDYQADAVQVMVDSLYGRGICSLLKRMYFAQNAVGWRWEYHPEFTPQYSVAFVADSFRDSIN